MAPFVRGYAAHRTDARRKSGDYDFLQEQSGPPLQLFPHAQPGAWLFALALWQPQLQAAPGQDEQLQDFELVNILDLLGSFDRLANNRSFAWDPPIGIERSSYCSGMDRLLRGRVQSLGGGALGTHVERGRKLGKLAAHQYGGRHPQHLIEGPCQVRGVGEVRRMGGGRNRSLRGNRDHGSRQLAP